MAQTNNKKSLRVAFIHPDLGIGGAERLVVDTALGLQERGHVVSIYTSHHDPNHCFDETNNGTLQVIHYQPPVFLPRSIQGKFHILFAHLRQLHLTLRLIRSLNTANPTDASNKDIDVFFVDQLSTCIPILRLLTGKRVVFYCHFPDKLLATGEAVEDENSPTTAENHTPPRPKMGFLKKIYRLPMDLLEEKTTSNADLILVNSLFTSRIFKRYFPSIKLDAQGKRAEPTMDAREGGPRVLYPGINLAAYDKEKGAKWSTVEQADVSILRCDKPTFVSLNRFESKKNISLAIDAFATCLQRMKSLPEQQKKLLKNSRLVIAGGYDPRLKDNIDTLNSLLRQISNYGLSWCLLASKTGKKDPPLIPDNAPAQTPSQDAQIIILPNFSTAQRTELLTSASTLALLYTPSNEHFGIVPVEAMACGLPVLACNNGGPKESILDDDVMSGRESQEGTDGWSVVDVTSNRTGWLRPPQKELWADALLEIATLSAAARGGMADRARARAQELFSMEAMSAGIERAIEDAKAMGPVKWAEVVSPEWFIWGYIVLVAFSLFCFGGAWTMAWTAVALGFSTLFGFF
ncbi:Alpha-1,3-mannosyltransferase-like protein [Serendipita sp. 411]|nr:Alpha-1,3-mannosyltransferase-like protein [Serendipita sp. 411]